MKEDKNQNLVTNNDTQKENITQDKADTSVKSVETSPIENSSAAKTDNNNENKNCEDLDRQVAAIEEQAELMKKAEANLKNTNSNKTEEPIINNVNNAEIQKLEDKIKSLKSHSKISNALVIAVILAFGGYVWYLNNTNTEALNSVKAQASNYAEDLKASAKRIEDDKNVIDEQIRQMQILLTNNTELKNQNNELQKSFETLKDKIGNETDIINKVYSRLDRYEARNPDDWRLAQSYFLVSSAYKMAVFSRDPKAALWCLTSADKLLIDIEDKNVIKIRKALSDDIMTVSNIPQIDLRGLVNKIDSIYNNLDKMTLREITTPEQRAEIYKKNATITDNLIEWKNNLVSALKDFSSRFIEIRHRDEKAVNAFLSADQAKLLLTNLKSQLILTKMAVYEQDENAYANNIKQILSQIEGYYNHDNPAYKTNTEALKALAQSNIAVASPNGLESYNLFDQYARQVLRFNTPEITEANK